MSSNAHKAGWIFNLDSEKSLKHYIKNGIYSTKIKPPKTNGWSTAYMGTIADYASMAPGQYIYFFIKRKIYGIGQLEEIEGTGACVFKNFEEALLPQIPKDYINNEASFYDEQLYYYEENVWNKEVKETNPRYYQQRWVCTFKPSPLFYDGIDMDEFLKFDKTNKDLRGLRTFWGLSFIKLSPSENDIIQKYIIKKDPNTFSFESEYEAQHLKLQNTYEQKYQFDLSNLIKANTEKNGTLKSEMLIEAYILDGLNKNDADIVSIFGHWDYYSHQVTASPFKPVDYMDKMDICGYSGGSGGFWNAERHLLIEIKKDVAKDDDIEQTRKYIKWLQHEYGAIDNVKVFLIASDFDISYKEPDIHFVKYVSNMKGLNFFTYRAE